jgi:Uma2 family endonuclease
MGQPVLKPDFNAEDYLAWEAAQTERHEYINGEVFNMAGAEDRHVTVTLNVAMALRQHLTGSSCRVFLQDMKVQAEASNAFFYPDVLVTCSAADRLSPLVKREPVLLVEVLSPSTAAFDRGEKFAHYRGIASLAEYVLIELDSRRVDVYRKGADGLWVLHPFAAGESVHCRSVELTVSAELLFAEVDDPQPPAQGAAS